jgi:outer membrane protein
LTSSGASAKYAAQHPGRVEKPASPPVCPSADRFGTAKECIAVRKFFLSAAAVAIVVGVASFPGIRGAFAQNTPAAGTPAVHKVGLIDMAHVFKQYKKFEALRDELKSEIEQADREAQSKAAHVKKLQEELKSSPFKPGSPEYNKLEGDITQLVAEFENFRRVSQREFLAKEAKVYKTIYLEVTDAVALYAKYYKYTLVLRFNREKIQDAQDPKEILNSMNHQVVYHVAEDDITLSVLKYLNDRYTPASGAAAPRGAARPAGTQRQ